MTRITLQAMLPLVISIDVPIQNLPVSLESANFPIRQEGPLIGITCAPCHAGFDPVHPPLNPNHAQRKNIHPTVGNQYVQIGRIFRANLSPNDPRYQIFSSWAPGAVDTTVLENDYINNPGMTTPIWVMPDRPFFDVTISGGRLPHSYNNRLGRKIGDPSVDGRIAAYEDAMDLLLNPQKRNAPASIQRTSDVVRLSTPSGGLVFPAGTPIRRFANLDPVSAANLCPDFIENQGHYFGAELSDEDKYALREFLKTR